MVAKKTTKPATAKKTAAKKAPAKKAPAKKAAAKKAPAKKAPAKKAAAKKTEVAAAAPKPKAAIEKPATRNKEEKAAGSIRSNQVVLAHLFALRPRVATAFKPDHFRQAKQQLEEESYASIQDAARAVAEKALELTGSGLQRLKRR